MIFESSAQIRVSINAGAEYVLKGRRNGQPAQPITVGTTRLLVWDRGSPVAFLHSGHNGTAPLRVPIERIIERRHQPEQDPKWLTVPTNGNDLMTYLRDWIAALPTAER